MKTERRGNPAAPFSTSRRTAYWHFGSPSLFAGANAVDPIKIEHVFVVLRLVMFAVQPSAVSATAGSVLPVDWVKMSPPAPIVAQYLTESAKEASAAVAKLRRSNFMEARYAFSFVLATFGIAIAAKMPLITTTISSSIRVKPLRFI